MRIFLKYATIFLLIFSKYYSFAINIENTEESDKKLKSIPSKIDKKEKLTETQILEKTQAKKIQKIWTKSLFIPGLGQIYNGKFLKAGICWIGFGSLFGGAYYFHNAFSNKENRNIKDRVYRNGLLVASFFWYVLNVLDAYVDAHMSYYDISPKISNITSKKLPGTEKKLTLRKKRKIRKRVEKKKKKSKRFQKKRKYKRKKRKK